MFPEMEEQYRGCKCIYTGCSDIQEQYSSGNTDPRTILVVGKEYIIHNAVVGSWSTALELAGIPGKTFNSVCFEVDYESK